MQRLLNGDIQKCRTDADEHQSGIVYLAISLLTHTQAFGGKGSGFFAAVLGQRSKVGGVHKVEEVGFILVAFFIQRLVVVDDDVESVAVPVLHGDELLVGVLVIEQVAGDGVAVLDKAVPVSGVTSSPVPA